MWSPQPGNLSLGSPGAVAQVELSGMGPVPITCSIRKFAALPDEKIRKKGRQEDLLTRTLMQPL
jgi:hypothetical protein